ncbi:MAG: formate dehydrogenase [Candidatus Handelsmanbacteria bacterium RIFCSPLOWO2_12_FULL_64_10]|uniref:Formate dehydrogenase n=1 Tax=Handelsmanbacteria sp. (strain RIFCSPLOWO2_12_FULL_64_10) TaxID=1817868 RepID=A0A1F6C7W4_HANXR|nr:MAG: formate dehydrogenase [Candidatus Handelsmanbacteria bacterium RIFCSPLOWO2_12_FULL_64_10]
MRSIKLFISADSSSVAAGADEVCEALEQALLRQGREATILRTGSRGAYFLEPMIEIETERGRLAYANVSRGDIPKLLKGGLLSGRAVRPFYRGPVSDIPFFRRQTRITFRRCGVVNPASIDDCVAARAYLPLRKALFDLTPQQVIDEVKASGLRGRGGAAFPTGLKWQTAKDSPADERFIVANGDEGDPGTYADRMLMEGDPHALIEGMAVAARAVGAARGYVYIRAEYPAAIRRVRDAIAQARAAGYLGPDILGSGLAFDLEVRTGAGAYICGEETALLESLEGRRGMVRPKPPYPAEQGLFGKPTVVNNVTTLSTVPAILENGGACYAAFGVGRSRGTIPLQLAGRLRTPGLVEVPFGMTLGEVIKTFGGGMPRGRRFKAVQVGGPLGAIFPRALLNTAVDFEAFAAAGGLLGHGGIVVFDEKADMVALSHHFARFFAHESCGVCTPCRIGTKRAEEILERVAAGETDRSELDLLDDLASTMRPASLCALGQMATNPVTSAMKYFPEEFAKRVGEVKRASRKAG